jgi:hypothetical protein
MHHWWMPLLTRPALLSRRLKSSVLDHFSVRAYICYEADEDQRHTLAIYSASRPADSGVSRAALLPTSSLRSCQTKATLPYRSPSPSNQAGQLWGRLCQHQPLPHQRWWDGIRCFTTWGQASTQQMEWIICCFFCMPSNRCFFFFPNFVVFKL